MSHANELMALSPADSAAWGGLLRTHKVLMAVMTQELDDAHGLALSSYDVLRHVALADGERLRMSELAEQVMITRSGLSGVVDRLQAAGLIEREPVGIDGRGAFAAITPRGWTVLRGANATITAAIHRQFLDHLSAHDRAALRRVWRKLGTAHEAPQSDLVLET